MSLVLWRRKPRLRYDPADQKSQELVREHVSVPRFLVTGHICLLCFSLQLPPAMACLAVSPLPWWYMP